MNIPKSFFGTAVMEQLILNARYRIKYVSKKKPAILSKISKSNTSNFTTELLQSELDQIFIEGVIDQNFLSCLLVLAKQSRHFLPKNARQRNVRYR